MFYTIYKTTNLLNGKFYIGKHKTKDLNDRYLGSGKLLRRAIKKYGIDNFHREILFVCDSEKQMNTLEKILVVPDSELNYNLCQGGHGGWGYLNDSSEKHLQRCRLAGFSTASKRSPEYYSKLIESGKNNLNRSGTKKGVDASFYGKKHSEEFKQKMSYLMKEKQKGSNNSQYGTCWITNGDENKKIKKEELDFYLGLGYSKGRIKGVI